MFNRTRAPYSVILPVHGFNTAVINRKIILLMLWSVQNYNFKTRAWILFLWKVKKKHTQKKLSASKMMSLSPAVKSQLFNLKKKNHIHYDDFRSNNWSLILPSVITLTTQLCRYPSPELLIKNQKSTKLNFFIKQ